MHRANASLLTLIGLLGCAATGQRAALGWSLGGEAHVFVSGDRFARDFYRQLTGGDVIPAIAGRPLVAVDARPGRGATVLSAAGAAPARLTLARFHAPRTCSDSDLVTELVLAFAPGAPAARAHTPVVALLDAEPFASSAQPRQAALVVVDALHLIRDVADRAERATRGRPLGLLHPPTLDPDDAIDAGEVVAVAAGYAVGFRASFVGSGAPPNDTTLITGVALTDRALRHLHWVVRPRRAVVSGGVIATPAAVRYSLRGAVSGREGRALLLVDEFADVAARDSRATAVDAVSGQVIAAQPLALRCP